MSNNNIFFPKEELDRIEKSKAKNEKFEDYFKESRKRWNEKIEPLFGILKEPITKTDSIMMNQAVSLAYKQELADQISDFLSKRSKEENSLKVLKREKFFLYALSSGLKTNMGEKTILIEGHINENQRSLELIETHIEFLRSCVKNLDSFGFTLKNIIELMNYLGR